MPCNYNMADGGMVPEDKTWIEKLQEYLMSKHAPIAEGAGQRNDTLSDIDALERGPIESSGTVANQGQSSGGVGGYAMGGIVDDGDDFMSKLQSGSINSLKFDPKSGLPPEPAPMPMAPTMPLQSTQMPGKAPNPLQGYLDTQRANLSKYGPSEQLSVNQDILKNRNSLSSKAPVALGGLADAIMQGVARAGSSNFAGRIQDKQDNQDKAVRESLEKAYGANKDITKEGMTLDQMSPESELSGAKQDSYSALLKKAGYKDADISKMSATDIKDLAEQAVKLRGDELDVAASMNKPNTQFTPGQKALDVSFGKDYNDYVAQGGAQGMAANFQKLDNSLKNLEHGGGGVIDRAGSILPDAIRGFVTPEYKQTEQDIRANVLAILRQTLGPQFTEKEGERIFSQTFDPTLKPQQNISRLKNLSGALRQSAQAKQDAIEHFEATGSLQGFKGQLPSFGSPTGGNESSPKGETAQMHTFTADKQSRLAELRKKRDMGELR